MKIDLFFENAKILFDEFEIEPLLYGSVGLEYLTGENLGSDDIDILIPGIFIKEKWNEFRTFLEKCGYELADENEHTFQKDGNFYSYARIEELFDFAGIEISDIEVRTENGVFFKILSLEQYLKVYQASAKDGYRINTRKKKDFEKIEFIKEHIK